MYNEYIHTLSLFNPDLYQLQDELSAMSQENDALRERMEAIEEKYHAEVNERVRIYERAVTLYREKEAEKTKYQCEKSVNTVYRAAIKRHQRKEVQFRLRLKKPNEYVCIGNDECACEDCLTDSEPESEASIEF